jgi:Protein of unknown function (DUF1566)/Repeat of unknown function (DUF5648)
MTKTHLLQSLSKFTQALKRFVFVSGAIVLISCGSNQADLADTQLSTGISASTKSAGFGKAASAEEIKAMSVKLGSYFNGQHASNPEALMGVQAPSSKEFTAQAVAASNIPKDVFRFFNTNTGAHFFTMSLAERDYVKNTYPFFSYEGTAFFAYPVADPELSPVYRFFNMVTGTHFFTISAAEKDHVIATWPTIYSYEGIAWHANTASGANLVPVYRFFNTRTGTHFYTTSAAERDNVIATLSWYSFEGIAYYVRQNATPDIVIASITPTMTTIGIATEFTVVGTNLPFKPSTGSPIENATLTLQDATCLAPTANTSTGFTIVCTPLNTTGTKVFTVKTASAGAVIDVTRSVTVIDLPPVSVSNLTDTGITNMQCQGAASDVILACSDPAAIALSTQQDGMVGRDISSPDGTNGVLGFSYSNIGTNPVTDCVKDNITGLIWEGEPLYVSGGNALTNARSSTLPFTNIPSHIAAINASNMCGFSDWRLPTRRELESLAYYGSITGGVLTDPTWIPNSSTSGYWSSTPYVASAGYYWIAGYGGATGRYPGNYAGVRLVR